MDIDVLDVQRLEEMTGGDIALVAEVLGIFCDQGDLWRLQLRRSEVPDGWIEICHSIKGAAMGLGALRLAESCSRAEKLGRLEGPQAGRAAGCVLEVRELLDLSIAAMTNLRVHLSAGGALSDAPPSLKV